MDNSRLKNKFEMTDDLIEVKIKNLESNYINPIDISSIVVLCKELRNKFIIQFIFFFLFTSFIVFLFYISITTTTSLFNKGIILSSIALGSFLILLVYLWKQIFFIKVTRLKKSQYGIVKNKYIFKKVGNKTVKEKYYITVIFSDSKTFVRNVICDKKTYSKLMEGDDVLVISFDNKHAFAIIPTV